MVIKFRAEPMPCERVQGQHYNFVKGGCYAEGDKRYIITSDAMWRVKRETIRQYLGVDSHGVKVWDSDVVETIDGMQYSAELAAEFIDERGGAYFARPKGYSWWYDTGIIKFRGKPAGSEHADKREVVGGFYAEGDKRYIIDADAMWLVKNDSVRQYVCTTNIGRDLYDGDEVGQTCWGGKYRVRMTVVFVDKRGATYYAPRQRYKWFWEE